MSVDDYSETRPEVLCATTPKWEDEIARVIRDLWQRADMFDRTLKDADSCKLFMQAADALTKAADTIKRLREERDNYRTGYCRYVEITQTLGIANDTLKAQVEALRGALKTAIKVAGEARVKWDEAPEGMKAGKLLIALSGGLKGYRADIDAIHESLDPPTKDEEIDLCGGGPRQDPETGLWDDPGDSDDIEPAGPLDYIPPEMQE